MTERRQVYKCEICGNIVEVLHEGQGELVCCGQPMKLFEEKSSDTSVEKHVPFVVWKNGRYLVKVGENVLHPMEEKHYIEWIELIVDGVVHRKTLKPGESPEVTFEIPQGKEIVAREYCNLHGLWVNKL